MAIPFRIGRESGDNPIRGQDDTITRIYYGSPPPRTAITNDNDEFGLSSRELIYGDRGVIGILQSTAYPRSKTLTTLSKEALNKPLVRYEPRHTPPDCFEAQDDALRKAEILLRETQRAGTHAKRAKKSKPPRRDSAVSEDDEPEPQSTVTVASPPKILATVESREQGTLAIAKSQDQKALAAAESQQPDAYATTESQRQAALAIAESQQRKALATVEPQKKEALATEELQHQPLAIAESQQREALATVESQEKGAIATTEPQSALITPSSPTILTSTEPQIIITTTEPSCHREDEARESPKRRKLSPSPSSSSPAQAAHVQPSKSRAGSESRFAKPKTPAATPRGESVVSVRSTDSRSSRRSRPTIKDDLTINSKFGQDGDDSDELEYLAADNRWYVVVGNGPPDWALGSRKKTRVVAPTSRRRTGEWREKLR